MGKGAERKKSWRSNKRDQGWSWSEIDGSRGGSGGGGRGGEGSSCLRWCTCCFVILLAVAVAVTVVVALAYTPAHADAAVEDIRGRAEGAAEQLKSFIDDAMEKIHDLTASHSPSPPPPTKIQM